MNVLSCKAKLGSITQFIGSANCIFLSPLKHECFINSLCKLCVSVRRMHQVKHAHSVICCDGIKGHFKCDYKLWLKDTFRYSYTYIETYISLIIDNYSVMAFVKHTYLHAKSPIVCELRHAYWIIAVSDYKQADCCKTGHIILLLTCE